RPQHLHSFPPRRSSDLGPLWPDRFEPLWTEFTDLSNGRGQSVSHGDLSAAASTISVIGPAMWPLVIRMKQDATLVASDVHELNLDRKSTRLNSSHVAIS